MKVRTLITLDEDEFAILQKYGGSRKRGQFVAALLRAYDEARNILDLEVAVSWDKESRKFEGRKQ